jgi:hypothetical protein
MGLKRWFIANAFGVSHGVPCTTNGPFGRLVVGAVVS